MEPADSQSAASDRRAASAGCSGARRQKYAVGTGAEGGMSVLGLFGVSVGMLGKGM